MFLTQVLLLETPTKLLVVNGWSNNQKVPNPQVLNVANPSESCELPEFPADLIWSVGGYTDEGAIICSGRHPHTWVETNECYLLDNNIGEFVKTTSSLTLQRALAGSVVTDNGKLWILGGYNGALPPEQQTELYGTIQMADDLDVPLYGLCVAKINETTAIATGGSNGNSQRRTYYMDFNSHTFSPGPAMIQSRSLHGCTTFEHNGRTIVMVAGGWNPNLDTTEFLDLSQDDPTWVLGPMLPYKMEMKNSFSISFRMVFLQMNRKRTLEILHYTL